jgi:uncharacterized protein (DUF433 family)
MPKTMTSAVKTAGRAAKAGARKPAPGNGRRRTARVATPVYDRHIEITPGIRAGKPRIAGRRIAVEDVVAMHLYHHQTIQHIVDSYDLAPAQVYAALTYYYDHRAEIDASLEEGAAGYESAARARASLVAQKLAQSSALTASQATPNVLGRAAHPVPSG